MISDREKQSVRSFAAGCNCAQSVLMTYADVLGLTPEQAAMVAVGFGGGMGRLRDNCGAFSAAVMLCGALEGEHGADKAHRPATYARVQEMHRRFLERFGTINCAELLDRDPGPESPVPEARTPAYYKSRPCGRIIRLTCQIIDDMLAEREAARKEQPDA